MIWFHRISRRGLVAFGHDIIAAGLSYYIALHLRIAATDYRLSSELVIEGALAISVIGLIVFWTSGLYRGVWRYASIDDLMAITRAVTITIILFMLVMFTWDRLDALPRSVPFINWFVLMALLGGPRFLYRFWKDRKIDLTARADDSRIPVILVGATDGADQFLRALRQSADAPYNVLGILSEHQDRVGQTIRGAVVKGTVKDLESVFKTLKSSREAPQKLILTKDEITGAPVRDLLDRAAELGMTLARMPKLTDLRDAASDGMAVKPVAIEDLLGRPQTPLDRGAMKNMIQGKSVLITGAGGSIGSELARQITAFEPASLNLLESNEFALYSIDQEIGDIAPSIARTAILSDVRDRARIFDIFDRFAPEVVFHAAALKHVPLVEANPEEGVRTNIRGTINVADACREKDVGAMVLISTDKAVNPTNVMGATKRAAEMYCQSLDRDSESPCRFVTVRFGNVLGSTGSVVPLFQKQLDRGGPLTVTDPEMTRFFMTIREAVELVLEASAIGTQATGTDGRIFVLDMGDPVRIVDLARQMIRLSGKEPEIDIPIVFTGIRPGEKLYEEVLHGEEAAVQTEYSGLLLAAPRIVSRDDLLSAFNKLFKTADASDQDGVVRLLHDLIPEYIAADERQRARAIK